VRHQTSAGSLPASHAREWDRPGAPHARRFELQGGENAPRAGRRAVECLTGRIAAAVQDDVRLLVSELVTNSVRHAHVGPDDSLTLVLSLSEQRLHVEVHDPGRGFEASRPAPRARSGGGSGLRIVERLADRWGVAHEADTCVWFEIDGAGRSR
jgi:hypothetical protein